MIIALAYIIPIVTCIILLAVPKFRNKTAWWEYLVVFLPSLLGTFVAQKTMEYANTSDIQWTSGLFHSVKHYDEWDEWIHKTCTRRVPSGRVNGHTTYRTVSYDCSYRKVHHEYWAAVREDGSEETVGREFFDHYRKLWGTPEKFIDCKRHYYRKDGDAQEYKWSGKKSEAVTFARTISYRNYFQGQHSLYSLEKVTKDEAKELGLYDYPKDSHKTSYGVWDYDQDPIIGINVHDSIMKEFKYTNAMMRGDLRVFLLVWPDSVSENIWKKQRSYWGGSNQNEIIICLGISKVNRIKWSKTFSWSPEPLLEAKLKRTLQKGSNLDIPKIIQEIKYGYYNGQWKPRNFEEYSYITPELYGSDCLIILIITILLNLAISWWVIMNEFDNNNKRNLAGPNPYRFPNGKNWKL